MPLAEAQSRQNAQSWSAEEELTITTIQQTESVPRSEAIRRMQRRKKASQVTVDRAWYATRLFDSWLLDFSIPVRTSEGRFVLAVPVGGQRHGGHVSFPSRKCAEQATKRLMGKAGFPNIRIERSRERGTHHLVRWGDDQPLVTERDNQGEAQINEHKTAGEFFGYSDSAIRAYLSERFGREAALRAGRMCRNPRCTRGDDGGPGSLAHLRADALYCDDACRKAAERGPRRENQPSDRQCLCGSRADKPGSLRSAYSAGEHVS